MPAIDAEPNLSALLHNNHRARLEREILPSYLRTCRWFGAKARTIREMRIIEQIPVAEDAGQLWLLQVDYTDGAPDIYSMPVQLETGPAAESSGAQHAAGGDRPRRRARASSTTRSGIRNFAKKFSN